MKMLRGFLLLALACGPPLWAQANPQNITSTAQTNCAHYDVTGLVTLGMQVTGTWSATLQPEVAIGGQAAQNAQVTPSNSSTAQATITSNGVYYANVSGATTFFLCATAIASGTASVWFQPSNHVNAGLFSGGGTGGGSAFAAITSGTNTTAAMLCGTGCSLGFTATGTLNANQILGNTVPTLATGFLNWTGSAWAFSAGGGGDTITSPNSTLTVGGTAAATTLDLNLATANTWTTTQTFSPSSTSQQAFVANNPSGTTVNIGVFKANNVTEAAVGNAGTITLGDGTNAAALILKNATSGQVALNTVAGALGSASASLPANVGIVAELNLAQTFTAAQTLPSPVLTGTPNASGATQFKLPVAAAFATLANGEVGYDSTNANWHFWQNGADVLMVPLAAGFASGHCGQPTATAGVWVIADAGAVCGTGSGANAALSNLSGVAVNAALLPGTTNTIALGSASFVWSNLFATTITGTGSNGGYAGTQGTGAGVTFGVGISGFYPDSVNNCLHQNLNNVDKNCIPNTAGSGIGLTTGGTISVSAAPLTGLATQTADTVVMNATGSTASPTAVTMPTCATSGHADVYDPSTHAWTCNVLSGGTSTIANGTSAMGTGAISSGTCATVVTTTATGVAATDAIIVSPNADPTGVTGYAVSATGSLYIQSWPTSGNVNFKVCNNTAGSLTPAALTLNWRVVR